MPRYVVKKVITICEYYEVKADHDDQAKKMVEYGGGIKVREEREQPRYINILPDFEAEV